MILKKMTNGDIYVCKNKNQCEDQARNTFMGKFNQIIEIGTLVVPNQLVGKKFGLKVIELTNNDGKCFNCRANNLETNDYCWKCDYKLKKET